MIDSSSKQNSENIVLSHGSKQLIRAGCLTF